MEIKTKKSSKAKLGTYSMQTDDLHQWYNIETNECGKVIISHLLINQIKNKRILNMEDIPLAWELIKLLKECSISYSKPFNFNFYLEDRKIKIIVGGDCATIKHSLAEYEEYLKSIYGELETYIEFQFETEIFIPFKKGV